MARRINIKFNFLNGMNIIGHKKLFLSFSLIITLLSIASIVAFGFHQGIDFKGGTLWQLRIAEGEPNFKEIDGFLKENLKNVGEIRLSYNQSENIFIARFGVASEAEHQEFLKAVLAKYPTANELSFESIGPSVGEKLRKNALVAIGLVLVGISLFIAFAFRKTSRPISSWKYGWVTLLTLFHDIIIPAGLLAYLGYLGKVEIDSNFVVALLVVMGFSVHDTIVIFDRIRENLLHSRGKTDFAEIINTSVNQTIARSINTSLTLILVLLALFFFGPITLKYFVLTLLVGVTTGAYSSIFVASPLLLIWQNLKKPA